MKRINDLLLGEGGSYILPFFWQHGESEEVLRDYMRAIDEANIHEVCLECRPHPDFCGEQWWHDMDIIMEEARARNMGVWLLDDAHFPTGYCNGGLINAPDELCKAHMMFASADVSGPANQVEFDLSAMIKQACTPRPNPHMLTSQNEQRREFSTDELWKVLAFRIEKGPGMGVCIDLTAQVCDGQLIWNVPDGRWRLYVEFYTQNAAGRSDYMNIICGPSVKVLINQVYEPTYIHYKNDFGKTFRGFFSDEPLAGNTMGTYDDNTWIGKDRCPLPWCEEMTAMLEDRLGDDWQMLMPLLWDDGVDRQLTARVRHAYMDAYTLMVKKNFSMQIGDWCADHGVMYIGHLLEDFNVSCTVNYLGDYFRAISGQHMAGIDVIGGGVVAGAANRLPNGGIQPNSTFYHFMLAKLASSCAHIDPRKEGRSVCEIFGAYGWGLGVRQMKPVLDNFLVRGVNHFTPHAFSPKAFPDPDCPPHFYAHGENPQYRAFGQLMQYAQRVCHLISGGLHVAPVALLHAGMSSWSGNVMHSEVPARVLTENQIDFDLVTPDLLKELADQPLENGLKVQGETYRALVIPEVEYVTEGVERFIKAAAQAGFPVFFVNNAPSWLSDAARSFAAPGATTTLEALPEVLRAVGAAELMVTPACETLRYYHYQHETDLYLFSNESLGETFTGTIQVAAKGNAYLYDPMENVVRSLNSIQNEVGTVLELTVKPYELVAVVFDDMPAEASAVVAAEGAELALQSWSVSICESKEYPKFHDAFQIERLNNIGLRFPSFSGFVRYETVFYTESVDSCVLWLEDAYESVEVWCNDTYIGQRLTPEFLFDLRSAAVVGQNKLRIEVATTLERKTNEMPEAAGPFGHRGGIAPKMPTGLVGRASVFVK